MPGRTRKCRAELAVQPGAAGAAVVSLQNYKKFRHRGILHFQKIQKSWARVGAREGEVVMYGPKKGGEEWCVSAIEAFLIFFGHKKHPELLSVAKKRVHLQTQIRRNVIIHNKTQLQTTMAYVITDICVACGTCQPVCPVEAISEGDIYHIDPDKCIECGSCAEVCPTGAINPPA